MITIENIETKEEIKKENNVNPKKNKLKILK